MKELKKILTIIYIKILNIRNRILLKISPKFIYKRIYKKSQGKTLNLKNPTLFNEKLMWLELNNKNNDLMIKCTDKYDVRQYVKEKGCGEILNELYGVYNDANEINLDELPKKFVLKCTHGCGFNIICDDKSKLDKKETIKKLNKWKSKRFGYETVELHYTKIKPRIICEKYLETDAGILPNDYKIYCFNGVPKLILVCTERVTKTRLDFFDLDWNVLDIGKEEYKSKVVPKKPENLKKMIEYAKKLSEPFEFVRVDFYNDNGKVIFGELTFTPAGCRAQYYTDNGNKMLGDMLKLK